MFNEKNTHFLTVSEASIWASKEFNRNISKANISYLIQYGRLKRYGNNGSAVIRKTELKKYYCTIFKSQEESWKKKLGEDLNWDLSFSEYKEIETTKHVHRLHPYKGKFIPQLVEYFLNDHLNKFKKEIFFNPGDIVLDPFCGSGTTLVQANELGLHAIGIDVSEFNSLISNVKIEKYDLAEIKRILGNITLNLKRFIYPKRNLEFEEELVFKLKEFNEKFFPSHDYKFKVRNSQIDERKYGAEKERDFSPIYESLINKYKIGINNNSQNSFLKKWYLPVVKDEIDFVKKQIDFIDDEKIKNIVRIILSRTIRSCRATTHSDLGTLKFPVTSTYYCKKHGKICKPIFSILSWWNRYGKDTINRLNQFDKLRTNTNQICLTGDSRSINIINELEAKKPELGKVVRNQKIKGIFSSPPYVGLIDYHEQHAYSYDLFGFDRNDKLEIGPLSNGSGKEARESYTKGIAKVLLNSKTFMQENYDVFLVANDKHGLYPKIAKLSGMKIVNQYKRPVLNRVEKDRSAYSEIIFHLKEL